ncbi:MAG: UDP-N-acetylmuramoyl-L-alanine--D-glutamate ligase [Alphaproteobacteria bacterium]|nr:UDP-N-acetylmuramoyl-L-alanine--D-glutamate ligase [Alphaproteobacteria bacterium]
MVNEKFDLKNKRILIVGFGKTGRSAAKFLQGKVGSLFVWDDSENGRQNIKTAGYLIPTSIEDIDYKALDFILWSPGIPHYAPAPHPIALAAKKAKVPLICDIDLFYQLYPKSKYIGVTGSNGKSTTVSLLKHIFDELGKSAYLAGNIGQPIFDLPPPKSSDFIILELSSYQLELCPHLRLKIGALLNITPDHLARHDGMKHYISAKEEILKKADQKIVCTDTPEAAKLAKKYFAIPVSTTHEVEGGVYAKDGSVSNWMTAKPRRYIDLDAVSYLKGTHNAQNIAVAFAVAKTAKLCGRRTTKAVYSFTGLAHRQEYVVKKAGIVYINDSKATNAEATEPALQTFNNIYLIAGGQAKEGGLDSILPLIKEKVRGVYLIGAAMDLFANQLGSLVPVVKSGTLDQALKDATTQARVDAHKNPTVLLSPACASWDQFDSFEHRGDAFKKYVKAL